jgi:cyclic dehypoxanthinyl futalosine synthase
MVMRIVNYTNVCVAQCDYCAFYVLPNQHGGYVLSGDEVFAKIDELVELGGDLVGFNGGFNPKLPLDYYCDLFRSVRERYGETVEFYALTVAEFVFLADRAGLPYAEAAVRLRDAAVRSSPRTSASGMPSGSTRSPTTSTRSGRSSRAGCGRPRRW